MATEKKFDEKLVHINNFAQNNLVQVVLIILLVIGSYLLGSVMTKVQILEKAGSFATTGGDKQVAPAPGTGAGQQAPPQGSAANLDDVKNAFNKSAIKFGDLKKKIVFVEIADPSCPFCHMAAGKDNELNKTSDQYKLVVDGGTYVAPVVEMKKLVDQGKAAFAYIYYPGHGNGEMATKAMYCANEKGKFWEVHDLLMSAKGYEIQNGTTPVGAATTGPIVKNDKTKSQDLATFLAPAFDPAGMKACLDSGKFDSQLDSDKQLAAGLKVSGTPGFFINATLFPGALNYKDMESVVTAALK